MCDNSNNRNLIFYAVYCLEFDDDLLNEDVLCQIRQELFTNGNKIRNKSNVNIGEKTYKYSYVLSPKAPLKWKKTDGPALLEKSFIRPDGSYSVVTQDEENNFVSKNITFSSDHKWIYTQYFNKDDKKTPVVSLTALSNNNILLKKRNALNLPIKINLVPCEYIQNEEERTIVNDEFGVPEVLVKTNEGDFYYCDSKIAELRKEALERLRAFNGNNKSSENNENINKTSLDDEVPSNDISIESVSDKSMDDFNDGFKINPDFMEEEALPSHDNEYDATEAISNESDTLNQPTKDTYDWGVQQNYTNKNTHSDSGFSITVSPNETVKAKPVEKITLPDIKHVDSDIDKNISDELSISKDANEVIKQAETIKDKLNENVDNPSVKKFINDIAIESDKEKNQIESFLENKIKEIDQRQNNKNLKYNNSASNSIDAQDMGVPVRINTILSNDDDDHNEPKNVESIAQNKNNFNKVNTTTKNFPNKNNFFPPYHHDNRNYSEIKNNNKNELNTSMNSEKITEQEFELPPIERTDEAGRVCLSDDNSSTSSFCSGATSGCPYQIKDKMNINVSDNERYYYFGEIIDNLRQGEGRTVMENGHTAYEGSYHKDKREGFGVYYYKTGRICHVGRWKNNKRHGTGIAFRPNNGTITVGNWIDDVQVGMGSSFDGKGNLIYAGRLKNGKRNGVGVSYSYSDGSIFVGQWDNGKPTGKGTQFDINGNLLYTGGFKDQKRSGFGTQYNENGDIVYIGEWKDDKYHGPGSLHLANGNCIKGIFEDGNISHNAQEFNEFGFKIYEGEWSNNKYNGKGCKYFKNGGRYEGQFVNGEPAGYLSGYDPDGELVYEGEWKNDMFNGNGTYYVNGEKVYEGSFVDNSFHGNGFEYQDGIYVYSGGFRNSRRCGFGTSYSDGKPIYSGTWNNDLYDGLGIIFDEGNPVLVGEFSKGKKNGRINVVSNGLVCEERIYNDDNLCYAKKYDVSDPSSISLIYEGNIKNGMLNGLGTTFTKFGEKELEGLFSNGKLIKSMKVTLITLPPLPKSNILSHTDYEDYRRGPSYVVEKQMDKMTYTGPIKDGLANGCGTALYRDHIYVGHFSKGVSNGSGIIYQNDGTIFEGKFLIRASEKSKPLSFTDGVTYNYIPQESKDN